MENRVGRRADGGQNRAGLMDRLKRIAPLAAAAFLSAVVASRAEERFDLKQFREKFRIEKTVGKHDNGIQNRIWFSKDRISDLIRQKPDLTKQPPAVRPEPVLKPEPIFKPLPIQLPVIKPDKEQPPQQKPNLPDVIKNRAEIIERIRKENEEKRIEAEEKRKEQERRRSELKNLPWTERIKLLRPKPEKTDDRLHELVDRWLAEQKKRGVVWAGGSPWFDEKLGRMLTPEEMIAKYGIKTPPTMQVDPPEEEGFEFVKDGNVYRVLDRREKTE